MYIAIEITPRNMAFSPFPIPCSNMLYMLELDEIGKSLAYRECYE